MAVKNSMARQGQLSWLKLQHPGGCYGYRIDAGGKRFCYLTDNEYDQGQFAQLVDFTAGADLVIWDDMFTNDEQASKAGWGHSSIEQGIDFYQNTDIKRLMITHHAPFRHDDMLAKLEKKLPQGMIFAKDQLRIML
tara:strand:- start:1471 stop:1878 length:408 start_codon:yes stop_codon:yes gene_type:complete